MGEREEMMRYHGVYTCPDWCTQDPDEEQYEHHWGAWREFVAHDQAVTIGVRPRLSWWTDDDGQPTEQYIELDVPENTDTEGVPSDNGRMGSWLSRDDLAALRELLDDAEADLESFNEKWAYPGAEQDSEAAEDETEAETVN